MLSFTLLNIKKKIVFFEIEYLIISFLFYKNTRRLIQFLDKSRKYVDKI